MLVTKLACRSNSTSTSLGNSLDWDSPSTVTGTVKRRPVSGSSDCDYSEEKCDSEDREPGGVSFKQDEESVGVSDGFCGSGGRKRKPKSLKTSEIPRCNDVGWQVRSKRGEMRERC